MSVTQQNNRKRDWSLIILILPLGVAMMLCVGQLAIRMSPNWTVEGEMKSLLDPEKVAKQDALVIQPISGDILTPVSWWNTFLTPSGDSGSGIVFPPFVIFEPTSTPTATLPPAATSTTTSTTTPVVTGTPPPPTNTPTKKPTDDENTATPITASPTTPSPTTPSPTAPSPSPTTPSPSPTTPSPSPTTPSPSPTTPSPSPTTPSPSPTTPSPMPCTDANATNYGGPLPCVYPIPVSSTLVGLPSPTPTEVTDPPNGNTSGSNVANIPNGYYVIVTLPTPIIVVGISDTGYDLVYYERQLDDSSMPSGYGVQMDGVILSISTAVNGTYYQVFNWGDGIPDTNSNLGDVAITTGTEYDNQPIDGSEFSGTYPQQTGIQIDVDNAPSAPPPGNYSYLAIQAPIAPPNNGNDGADVDAVEVLP